jgi:hypothetical protein
MITTLRQPRKSPFNDDGGHYWNGERIDLRYPETFGEAVQRHLANKRLAAAPTKPAPAKPTGPHTVGSRDWAAELIRLYGQARGVEFMRREVTLAQAAAEHSAAAEKAWREKVNLQKAEIARLEADLAKQERRAAGKGIRMSKGGFKVSFGTKPPTTPAA